MEHAYYSVISPEGCAAILWKDGERSAEAANALKLTAPDLLGLGVVDEIVPEPLGGAHRKPDEAIANVRETILRHLDDLDQVSTERLIRERRRKFRQIAEIEGRFPTVGAGN